MFETQIGTIKTGIKLQTVKTSISLQRPATPPGSIVDIGRYGIGVQELGH